ncbi:phytanoyl-CoA dioxygenase family protein [Paenibacillus montanisoli]|uniref:phytanoyl-CoA dioxygenase family protein n=1 Tax=Paenibacillus montanisoli TaxID=2081970 RepID=UPI001402B5A2|nr:phytanoyl-CoA dioxygenase family protein [Paenibacillus montanisoli]
MASSMIKEQFQMNGYYVLNRLFTEEEAAELKKEAQNVLDKNGVDKSGVYVGMAVASPLFKEAAAHPLLVKALEEIIGDHVIFLSDKVVFKNATTDFGSPWHQDYPYWYGSHKYSVWIALDDATIENGCLRIVPGSHHSNMEHADFTGREEGFSNRLKDEDIKPETIVDLTASRGDAIIFHDLLFHASYPNRSGKDRWALISTYKDGNLEDPDYAWAKAAFRVNGQ